MEQFNQMSPADQIGALCNYHECKPKIRKIHFDQYVYRRWNPHPPTRFVAWWKLHPDVSEKTTALLAFNCENYRQQYLEAKEFGVA